jgi:hypothetical protein
VSTTYIMPELRKVKITKFYSSEEFVMMKYVVLRNLYYSRYVSSASIAIKRQFNDSYPPDDASNHQRLIESATTNQLDDIIDDVEIQRIKTINKTETELLQHIKVQESDKISISQSIPALAAYHREVEILCNQHGCIEAFKSDYPVNLDELTRYQKQQQLMFGHILIKKLKEQNILKKLYEHHDFVPNGAAKNGTNVYQILKQLSGIHTDSGRQRISAEWQRSQMKYTLIRGNDTSIKNRTLSEFVENIKALRTLSPEMSPVTFFDHIRAGLNHPSVKTLQELWQSKNVTNSTDEEIDSYCHELLTVLEGRTQKSSMEKHGITTTTLGVNHNHSMNSQTTVPIEAYSALQSKFDNYKNQHNNGRYGKNKNYKRKHIYDSPCKKCGNKKPKKGSICNPRSATTITNFNKHCKFENTKNGCTRANCKFKHSNKRNVASNSATTAQANDQTKDDQANTAIQAALDKHNQSIINP